MIEYISINIKNGGLTHTIQLDTDIGSNLPYDLADAFAEVIRLTNANPDMVVEQLINEYGLPENVKNDSVCNADEKVIANLVKIEEDDSIWHDVSEEPNMNRSLWLFYKGTLILLRPITLDWEEIKSKYNFSKWAYFDSFEMQSKFEFTDPEPIFKE